MKLLITSLIILGILFQACTTKKSVSPRGLTPQESLPAFQLPEGFKIELVASEPMISDPVAMEVDENGNMYVVEMHGYPLDTAGSGVVKLLTDTNGDGTPDKSVVFADHLKLPTGIMKWKKGILVVDVPDILYFEDTNNDGKADIKEVMITGLALTNPQHIANTPIYGLDNWIYVAHMGIVTPKVSMEFNDTGTNVRFTNYPLAKQLPRNADGRNLRFKPDTHELEMLSGESQYGQTFDNWGHQLGTSNADHLFHEVIAARYLQRNPDLLVSESVDHIPDHGEAAEVYPITKNPEHQLLTDVGVITSSCGVTWYQGGLFPDSFNNVTFIAEPVHNLVHADRITDKGATFNAARVYHKKEFLASTDAWCRPVQFYIGPDGALYVIDYYREIIEHPEWMSDSVNNSGALYNGSDKGRIYRVTPVSVAKMNWCSNIKLGSAPVEELVQTLTSGNIWWRRNAQRLLVDKNDPQTVSLLHKFLDTATSPTAIVHALWILEGFGATDEATLKKAFQNRVAGVRENAIKIAELHLQQMLQLENDLLSLQSDTSAKVRYQLLCTLGNLNDAITETVRQKLLMKDIEDKWVQVAALTSSAGKEYALIEKTIPALSAASAGKTLFFQNCAAVIGLSQRINDIKKLMLLATKNNTTASAWWQAACLDGLSKAIHIKGVPEGDFTNEKQVLLSKFNGATPSPIRKASLDLLSLTGIQKNAEWNDAVTSARSVAANKQADLNYRNDALRLIAFEKNSNDTTLLEQVITPTEPETLQQTALYTLNEISEKAATDCILRNWKNFTHDLRDAAIEIFLSSPYSMNALLDAVQQKQIQATSISWPRMVSLMNNDDMAIRNRARKLLAGAIEDRDVVYKKYEPALSMKGDAKNGLAVFQRVCTSCHQVGGQYGKAFGPDLASIRNRDAQFIMADILNPNRSIADKYEMWTVVKTNDEKLSGIIASETPSAITLHNIGAQEIIVSRSDIKTLEVSETSAMPVGLEASVSVKEMADILAFLKNIH
ncbi:MAG: PVC-type heme-binding CxxCH protein [Ginsengibacter sp.]